MKPTKRQLAIAEHFIMKVLNEESATTFPQIFSLIQKSKFADRIINLQDILYSLNTINNLQRSGIHPDRLFSFFTTLNEKMKDIDFLVDNFSKELKNK
jgi:hypothetical protein